MRTSGWLAVVALLSGLPCLAQKADAGENAKPAGICGIVSSETVAKTQAAQFVTSKATANDDGRLRTATCFYKLSPEVQSVSVELISRSASGSIDPRELWREKFRGESESEDDRAQSGREDSAEERKEHKEPVHLEGVGDDAFWVDTGVGGALYVLQGERIVRVSLGGAATDSEKQARAVRLAKSIK